MAQTITRSHMEAILAATDADFARIPTIGVAMNAEGFSLDREQVGFLRDTLNSPEANDILANEQDACRESVRTWLTAAKLLKLDNVVRACEAALTE